MESYALKVLQGSSGLVAESANGLIEEAQLIEVIQDFKALITHLQEASVEGGVGYGELIRFHEPTITSNFRKLNVEMKRLQEHPEEFLFSKSTDIANDLQLSLFMFVKHLRNPIASDFNVPEEYPPFVNSASQILGLMNEAMELVTADKTELQKKILSIVMKCKRLFVLQQKIPALNAMMSDKLGQLTTILKRLADLAQDLSDPVPILHTLDDIGVLLKDWFSVKYQLSLIKETQTLQQTKLNMLEKLQDSGKATEDDFEHIYIAPPKAVKAVVQKASSSAVQQVVMEEPTAYPVKPEISGPKTGLLLYKSSRKGKWIQAEILFDGEFLRINPIVKKKKKEMNIPIAEFSMEEFSEKDLGNKEGVTVDRCFKVLDPTHDDEKSMMGTLRKTLRMKMENNYAYFCADTAQEKQDWVDGISNRDNFRSGLEQENMVLKKKFPEFYSGGTMKGTQRSSTSSMTGSVKNTRLSVFLRNKKGLGSVKSILGVEHSRGEIDQVFEDIINPFAELESDFNKTFGNDLYAMDD
eukprot:Lithocolla_globosa_v1_NODE_6_length_11976_cov_15.425432.p2 type:complete len:525 gc:universal NODE_6_length_11976_cov_15.425432:1610-36(-)